MKTYKAFTLTELLLVVTIMALMAAVGYSAVINYYRTSILDSELRIVTTHVRRARQQAIGNKDGDVYSIKFLETSYVLMPGTVYAPLNPDNKEYTLETSVIVSTTYPDDMVTFDQYTGRTNVAGTIYLSAFGQNKEININSLGIVEEIQ